MHPTSLLVLGAGDAPSSRPDLNRPAWMLMRNKLASALLIASVFVWGIWCGGQVFNELMTVPKWSASPPESLKTYDALPSKGGLPFFPLFNPLFVVMAIGATIAAWKSARRARKWLALSAGT